MKYISTRGLEAKKKFTDIVLTGLASDGGLMMPETYPLITKQILQQFRSLSYPELAYEIMKLYISDIPSNDLRQIIHNTYTENNFKSKAITPLRKYHHNLYVLGLSNGPTLAFKDLAMQFLGNLFEYILTKKHQSLNILGATSGDTGSAAEYAMKGKANIQVFMLSPEGKMSNFQRAQMYSLLDKNIHNIAIRGLFDDCQDIVKKVQSDLNFKTKYQIGTVNSINWGRILAQTVYYFKAYLAITEHNEEEVSFCVPSGNFGDICAGHIAKSMGLPIKNLIVATNENNVLEEFFNTGIYQPKTPDQVHTTSSPSMDIAKASNLERFIFDLVDRDGDKIRELWEQLNQQHSFNLSHLLPRIQNQYGFYAGSSTHKNRLETIRKIYVNENDLIDPHTADGIFVASKFKHLQTKLICLETALPIKFEATIQEALGTDFVLPRPKEWQQIEEKTQKVHVLDNDFNQVKNFIKSQILL